MAAFGLTWLFGLHLVDKAGTSLYSSALLVYFAVLADSGKANRSTEGLSPTALPRR